MIILVRLLLAHLIGDFVLQSKAWVKEKESKKIRSPKLYLHAFIHGALVLLLLGNIHDWLPALILMILHGIIDVTKLYLQKDDNKIVWFIIDQGLHLISILLVWLIGFSPVVSFSDLAISSGIWIYAAALLFITSVSGITIQIMMTNWSKSLNESDDESLVNAGKYIGILERLFVFTFIVTGHWEGIGFLLAAKSIFRFGDLKDSKDRKLTEYILIGTLLSFAIATATAIVVLQLVDLAK